MWNDPETPLFQEAQEALAQLKDAVVSLRAKHALGPPRTHLEGALVAPWLVALGTLHGTEPLTHWEDVDAAVAQLHPPSRSLARWLPRRNGTVRCVEDSSCAGPQRTGYHPYTQTFLWAKELCW